MKYGLIQELAPTVEPVTLSEAKMHLKLDDLSPDLTPDNALITMLIKAARRWAEMFTNRAYATQTWILSIDEFPKEDYIEIPKPPLQYVDSLVYKDSSGVDQTVSFLDPSGTVSFTTDDYIVDINREPGRLYLRNGAAWPATLLDAQAVRIHFVTGYGDADSVPEHVKLAILLRVSDYYENRGDDTKNSMSVAKALLWPDRIVPL